MSPRIRRILWQLQDRPLLGILAVGLFWGFCLAVFFIGATR